VVIVPGEPFPEDWKPEVDADDKHGAASSRAPKIDTMKATYKSCWIVLKEKALREGVPWESLVESYKGRLLYSVDSYMNFGPAVVQFRSELLTWRDLCKPSRPEAPEALLTVSQFRMRFSSVLILRLALRISELQRS
jgi:hypothetical protein